MREVLREGLDIAGQLAAFPFKAARRSIHDTAVGDRPLGEVIDDSLHVGETLARLPFKAAAALLAELRGPD